MPITTHERREQIGEAIYRERNSRGWSVEAAILKGGIGHMTWRRIERGETVQARSYRGVDTAFDWPRGHTLAAVEAADESVELGQFDPSEKLLNNYVEHSSVDTAHVEASFDAVLRATESLTLSELGALNTIIEQRIEVKTEYLDAMHQTLSDLYVDCSIEAMTLYDYFSQLSTDTVTKHQQALITHLQRWKDVQDMSEQVYRIETNTAASVATLESVKEHVDIVDREVREATTHLRDCEQQALRELRENNIEPQLEGST